MSLLTGAVRAVSGVQSMQVTGRVVGLRGMMVLVQDLPLPVGSLVSLPRVSPGDVHGIEGWVDRRGEARALPGEVVGFQGQMTMVMMLGQTTGIRVGDRVIGMQASQTVHVGLGMLGRVIDGLGRPIDGKGPMLDLVPRELDPRPVWAMRRVPITRPMHTGVRAIDLMTTLGRGQRMGIFAGPGVGKSTLLGSIARNCSSDVNVLALIGERGREVKDFIEGVLGPEGLARSVVVVSTGDETPLMRIRAAMAACTVAEFFREQGQHVMLLLDSVTRFAHAHRQIGLAVGEPPASKGYTPGVFAALARLLERAGQIAPRGDRKGTEPGSITGLYTVLVEGDDMTEPIADAARGILDGHLILSRALAQRAHFPAIDVLDSVSRVADEVTDEEHQVARRTLVRTLAMYRDVEDLVQIGAYAKGANAENDVAIEFQGRINELLRQSSRTREAFAQSRTRALRIANEILAALQSRGRRAG